MWGIYNPPPLSTRRERVYIGLIVVSSRRFFSLLFSSFFLYP